MGLPLKAAQAFEFYRHSYAEGDTIDTTGWSQRAVRLLLTSYPVYYAAHGTATPAGAHVSVQVTGIGNGGSVYRLGPFSPNSEADADSFTDGAAMMLNTLKVPFTVAAGHTPRDLVLSAEYWGSLDGPSWGADELGFTAEVDVEIVADANGIPVAGPSCGMGRYSVAPFVLGTPLTFDSPWGFDDAVFSHPDNKTIRVLGPGHYEATFYLFLGAPPA